MRLGDQSPIDSSSLTSNPSPWRGRPLTTAPDAQDQINSSAPLLATLSHQHSVHLPAQTPPAATVRQPGVNTSRRILLMGFTLGSLAVMSGYRPLVPSSFFRVSALFELRSLLLSVVVFFVLLVLAYLTNPSEASFRAFLTEQAFRHHLSRLDDADAHGESESASAATNFDSRSRRGLNSTFTNRSITSYVSPPFAFASRASVSLRTPKHIFRSFGILSVAAVVPTSQPNQSSSTRRQNGDDSATRADKESGTSSSTSIFDSWFIGAFGMWFWTFNLDGLWRDAGLVAKDEVDSTITGVLGIKALDRSDECNRTPFSLYGNGSSSHGQRSSPKLRPRERPVHQSGNALNHRSQTPPPLPKSASLPLHTKRGTNASSPEKSTNGRNQHSGGSLAPSSGPSIAIQPPISITPEFRSINASAPSAIASSTSQSTSPSRSPSTLFASSPLIAELLRQLSSSQNAISDLRTQLSDFDSASAVTRGTLDNELNQQRERKRADDAAKAKSKAELRALDDQKRVNVDAQRRAEKRLSIVQSEKDNADARIERYERDTNRLQSQMEAHSTAVATSGVETAELVAQLEQQIESKRSKVRTTEDEVAQLSLRLRDLEEKVANEEQRLKEANEEAEKRRERSMLSYFSHDDGHARQRAFAGHTFPHLISSEVGAAPLSPVRTTVPESSSSAMAAETHSDLLAPPVPMIDANLANTFPVLGPAFNPHRQIGPTSHRFSPFSSDLASPGPLSPTGESLIPSSLYEPLGMGISKNSVDSTVTASDMSVSRSFQSEDDVILDRNWFHRRSSSPGDVSQVGVFPSTGGLGQNSPVSPTVSMHDYDTFSGYDLDHHARGRASSFSMNAQRASFPNKLPSSDFALQQAFSNNIPATNAGQAEPVSHASTRRSGWFTSHKDKNAKTHEKKGLNPDAKEFSLSKDKERTFSAILSRSRGSGSGHSSGSGSGSGASSTPSSAELSTPEPPSLNSSPSLTSAIASKNPSPQTHMTAPKSTTHSFLSLGSAWFGSRAFAPTPFEREQLSRALGGTANSSFEKLERLPSLPTSPQPKHALASQTQSVVSLPLGTWDATTPVSFGAMNGSKSKALSSVFSPFDDELVAASSSSPSDESHDGSKREQR